MSEVVAWDYELPGYYHVYNFSDREPENVDMIGPTILTAQMPKTEAMDMLMTRLVGLLDEICEEARRYASPQAGEAAVIRISLHGTDPSRSGGPASKKPLDIGVR